MAELQAPPHRPVCVARGHQHSTSLAWCRYSNVVLTDASSSILLCAYQVGSKMSSARQLQTGGTYQLPPKPQGIQPDLGEPFDSWQRNVSQAAQMLADKAGQAPAVASGMVRAYQVGHSSTPATALLAGPVSFTACLA